MSVVIKVMIRVNPFTIHLDLFFSLQNKSIVYMAGTDSVATRGEFSSLMSIDLMEVYRLLQ